MYKIRLPFGCREVFLGNESLNSMLEGGTKKKRDGGSLARSNFPRKKRGERNPDHNGEPHGERRSLSFTTLRYDGRWAERESTRLKNDRDVGAARYRATGESSAI